MTAQAHDTITPVTARVVAEADRVRPWTRCAKRVNGLPPSLGSGFSDASA